MRNIIMAYMWFNKIKGPIGNYDKLFMTKVDGSWLQILLMVTKLMEIGDKNYLYD